MSTEKKAASNAIRTQAEATPEPAAPKARPINDVTAWELANVRPGWIVEVPFKGGAASMTVRHVDGGRLVVAGPDGTLYDLDRSLIRVVIDRPQTDWELDVTRQARNHRRIGHADSKYTGYSNLQLGQHIGRRWNALAGGNKLTRILKEMSADCGLPAEASDATATPKYGKAKDPAPASTPLPI